MTWLLIILLGTLTIWRVLDIVEANAKDYYKQKRDENNYKMIDKYKDEA